MKLLSLPELMHLSRFELCEQLATLSNMLPALHEGSEDAFIVRANLRRIRRALMMRASPEP